ncbi:MAG: GNAT family N-acetyltransferase [Candidatus Neomarinimicrobiota bacterium]
MKKILQLKDGASITIRPMRKDDLARSLAFFQALPEEDRRYLRREVTSPEAVEERIKELRSGKVKRLVAIFNEEIVADGSLELETQEWKKHMAEIRLIIARPFQRRGLGTLMARELYLLAARERVEVIVVKMMGPQIAARGIFKRLGFSEDVILSEYVRDRGGSKQDLIVMRCNLKSLMKEMEDHLADTDWQRTR